MKAYMAKGSSILIHFLQRLRKLKPASRFTRSSVKSKETITSLYDDFYAKPLSSSQHILHCINNNYDKIK